MEQKSYYDDLIERIKTIKTDKIDDTEIDQYEEETKRKMKQIGVDSDFIRRSDSTVVTNHIDKAKDQLTRMTFNLPKLILKNNSIEDINFEILGYMSDGVLKAELSN